MQGVSKGVALENYLLKNIHQVDVYMGEGLLFEFEIDNLSTRKFYFNKSSSKINPLIQIKMIRFGVRCPLCK